MRAKTYLMTFILGLVLLGIALSGCGSQVEFVDFSHLTSQPDQYHDQTIIMDAFYFSGFEISTLAESLEASGPSNGRLVPAGALIWVAGGISQALYEKLYTQTDTPSGYLERFGKMRIAGKFESGGKYGHLNSYNYQITITSAIPLEGTPVPNSSADKPAGVRSAASTEFAAVLLDNLSEAQLAAQKTAGDFILNSSTFKFDGIEGSLKFSEIKPSPISSFRSEYYVFTFQTRHPGHGDRAGQFLAEYITAHKASILINQETGEVISAECDNTWDMLIDKDMPVMVEGIVVSGGDTAQPGGPLDVPHRFIYRILSDEGYFIDVSYTAYPPSPAGDAAGAKISLKFFSGEIRVGDKIKARGTLEKQSNTIVVADSGDFINTSLRKSIVLGVVVGIEAAVEGQPKYELIRDDGTRINVIYETRNPTLSLYDETIKVGDYMKASGAYDKISNSVVVSDTIDFIKTYDHRTYLGE